MAEIVVGGFKRDQKTFIEQLFYGNFGQRKRQSGQLSGYYRKQSKI